jgi:DnaJ family protein C protein 17
MADDLPPDFDIYAFLDLTPSATDTQIRKAYRTKSLLYHPDKNPSPSAVQNFHYLKLALDILQSATARTAYDNVRKAKAAKAERTAKYDSERRRMQRDLETRERDAKRRRVDGGLDNAGVEMEERDLKRAVEKLKEESERLKRERDRRITEELRTQEGEMDGGVEDESQRTVKVRFQKGVDRTKLSSELLEDMFSKYGDVENVILGKSALVVFETISGARAAVTSKKGEFDFVKDVSMAESPPLENTTSEHPFRPETTSEKTGDIFAETPSSYVKTPAPAEAPQRPRFSFKPTATTQSDGADYESITLLRMRKLEREKLEREIRESEEMTEKTEAGISTTS